MIESWFFCSKKPHAVLFADMRLLYCKWVLGPVPTSGNSQLLRQFCANQGSVDAACPKASKEMLTMSGAKLTKRWLLPLVGTGPNQTLSHPHISPDKYPGIWLLLRWLWFLRVFWCSGFLGGCSKITPQICLTHRLLNAGWQHLGYN